MADIDVVPKRRTNTWLWIIAAIIVALVVMALLGMFSGDTTNRVGQLMTPHVTVPLQFPPGIG